MVLGLNMFMLVLFKNLIFNVQEFIFFALNVDEVMIIDNQQWINLHVYVMKN
jgi:hypothetical protein